MRDIIAAGLADLGLLDRVPEQAPSQAAGIQAILLLEKNQVMNLTAITDPGKGGPAPYAGLRCPAHLRRL